MKTYEFSIILKSGQITDEQCDVLHDAGCDDGTIVTRDGVTRDGVTRDGVTRDGVTTIAFDRESDSLENAIRSATADVNSAGFGVARIEMDALV